MSQITLRDLPEPLERQIRREAHRNRMSLNKTIIRMIEKGLGVKAEAEMKRDLSGIAGTWNESAYKELQDSQSIFQAIDAENWRS
jgi:hypothetical protein